MLKIAAYHSPTTLDEAVTLLSEAGRTVIAGGTDLLVNPRYMVGVREVVDISQLGLNYITLDDQWLHIGAAATMRTVARHLQIQAIANGILARSAAVCASPNIRNMATLVGNCASALPSADTPPALLALNASAVLVGIQGERVVPLDSFFVGPGKSVSDRELIREIRIPVPPRKLQGGFYKIGRTADDISMVNAATALVIEHGEIVSARLVLGAVAPIPLRIPHAEELLQGQSISEELLQAVAEVVRSAVRPISDQRASADYRRRMSGVATVRALRQAVGLAPQREEWHHA